MWPSSGLAHRLSRLWQSIDSTVYGPVHAGLAELAAQRRSGDTSGVSYDRYDYNCGISLVDVGFIRNPIGLSHLASLMAYRGEVRRALHLASEVGGAVTADGNGLELCDVVLAPTVIYDVVQIFGSAVKQLRQTLSAAERLGDELTFIARRLHSLDRAPFPAA